MNPFNRTLVLAMRETHHYLIDCHALGADQARELIELVVLAQWAALKQRQLARVYDLGHPSTLDAVDYLDDALFDFCADFTQPERFGRMRRAARHVLIDLLPEDDIWSAFEAVDVTQCRMIWRRHDLLIRAH